VEDSDEVDAAGFGQTDSLEVNSMAAVGLESAVLLVKDWQVKGEAVLAHFGLWASALRAPALVLCDLLEAEGSPAGEATELSRVVGAEPLGHAVGVDGKVCFRCLTATLQGVVVNGGALKSVGLFSGVNALLLKAQLLEALERITDELLTVNLDVSNHVALGQPEGLHGFLAGFNP